MPRFEIGRLADIADEWMVGSLGWDVDGRSCVRLGNTELKFVGFTIEETF